MSNFHSAVEELQKWGVNRVTLPGTRRMVFRAECSCGEVLDKSMKSTLPPEAVIKFIEQAGWELSKKHPPICVSCQEKEKEMARKTKSAEETTTDVPAVAFVGVEEHKQSDRLDLKIVRRVYAALDAVFDEHTGRYEKGWSDERIAKENGVAVDQVSAIRSEAYGEIAEDPEIIKLRSRFDALKKEIFDTENAILTQMDEKMKPLRDQLNQIDQSLKEQGA